MLFFLQKRTFHLFNTNQNIPFSFAVVSSSLSEYNYSTFTNDKTLQENSKFKPKTIKQTTEVIQTLQSPQILMPFPIPTSFIKIDKRNRQNSNSLTVDALMPKSKTRKNTERRNQQKALSTMKNNLCDGLSQELKKQRKNMGKIKKKQQFLQEHPSSKVDNENFKEMKCFLDQHMSQKLSRELHVNQTNFDDQKYTKKSNSNRAIIRNQQESDHKFETTFREIQIDEKAKKTADDNKSNLLKLMRVSKPKSIQVRYNFIDPLKQKSKNKGFAEHYYHSNERNIEMTRNHPLSKKGQAKNNLTFFDQQQKYHKDIKTLSRKNFESVHFDSQSNMKPKKFTTPINPSKTSNLQKRFYTKTSTHKNNFPCPKKAAEKQSLFHEYQQNSDLNYYQESKRTQHWMENQGKKLLSSQNRVYCPSKQNNEKNYHLQSSNCFFDNGKPHTTTPALRNNKNIINFDKQLYEIMLKNKRKNFLQSQMMKIDGLKKSDQTRSQLYMKKIIENKSKSKRVVTYSSEIESSFMVQNRKTNDGIGMIAVQKKAIDQEFSHRKCNHVSSQESLNRQKVTEEAACGQRQLENNASKENTLSSFSAVKIDKTPDKVTDPSQKKYGLSAVRSELRLLIKTANEFQGRKKKKSPEISDPYLLLQSSSKQNQNFQSEHPQCGLSLEPWATKQEHPGAVDLQTELKF